MTISSGTPASFEYTESGASLNSFNLGFPSFEETDIVGVEVEDTSGNITALTLGVDYSLNFVGIKGQDTELVLTGGALSLGYILRAKFSTEVFQGTSFENLGRFSPTAFESVLDRFAMFLKAIKDLYVNFSTELADHESRIQVLEGQVSYPDPSVSVETIDFTADFNKLHVINGASNVQLPAPVVDRTIRLKKLSSGDVNVLRSGAEKIDGNASNLVLDSDLEYIEFVTDGTDWFIL